MSSSFSDRIVASLLRLGGRVSRSRTFEKRQALGRRIGRLLQIDKKRLAITRNNIAAAFPEESTERVDAIARGAYENLGITLAELLAVPDLTKDELLRHIRIPGIEMVKERSKAGQPSILLSGHFGNWEYLAMAAGLLIEAPVTIVVHPQRNAIVNSELNNYRTKFGNVVVPMHDAARSLVRTLQQGGTVAFLVDQHAHPERDPWIPFFGKATPTYAAPAALAIRYNVPIFHAYAQRLNDGTYLAPLTQLDMEGLPSGADGIVELTRRHVQALENEIRKTPHLWSWQHRRWRN